MGRGGTERGSQKTIVAFSGVQLATGRELKASRPKHQFVSEKNVEIPEVERRHLRYTMHNLIICSEGFGLSYVMYTFPPGKERFCLSGIQ